MIYKVATTVALYLYIIDSGIPPDAHGVDVFDFTGTNPYDCPNGHGTRMLELVTKGLEFQPVKTTMLKAFTCIGVVENGTLNKIAQYMEELPIGIVLFAISSSKINYEIDDFMERVIGAGHIIVSAAGNHGKDACLTSPAHIQSNSHIVVGATNSPISNVGTCVNATTPSNSGTSVAAAKLLRMILDVVLALQNSKEPIANAEWVLSRGYRNRTKS
jgi:hypothetical protein